MPNTTNQSIELEINLGDSSKERNKSLEKIKELASTIVEGYSKIKQTIKNTIEENQKITNESGVFFNELRKVHVSMWNYYEENLVNALAKYDQKDCLEIKDIFQDKLITNLTLIKNEIENLINEHPNESTVNGINYDVSDELVAIFDNFYSEIRMIKNLSEKDYDFFLQKIAEMKINRQPINEDEALTQRLMALMKWSKLQSSNIPVPSNENEVLSDDNISHWLSLIPPLELSNPGKSNVNAQDLSTSTDFQAKEYKKVLFEERNETIMNLITSCLRVNLYFMHEDNFPFIKIMLSTLTFQKNLSRDDLEKEYLKYSAKVGDAYHIMSSKKSDAEKTGQSLKHIITEYDDNIDRARKERIKVEKTSLQLEGRLLVMIYLKRLYLECLSSLEEQLKSAGFYRFKYYKYSSTDNWIACLKSDVNEYHRTLEELDIRINNSRDPNKNIINAQSVLDQFKLTYQPIGWLKEQLRDCGFKSKNYLKYIDTLKCIEKKVNNNISKVFNKYQKKAAGSTDRKKDKSAAKKYLEEFRNKVSCIDFMAESIQGYKPSEIDINKDGFTLSEEINQSNFFKLITVDSDVKSECANQQTSNLPTPRS